MKLLHIFSRNFCVFKKRFCTKTVGEQFISYSEPAGFDTGISLYNTVVKKRVVLKTKQKGIVSWYACGPTVYDSAHIGHACCYIYQDIIRRILEDVFQLNVVMVMGITDIDDKIIKAATTTGKDYASLAKHYEKEFFSDISKLNILSPTVIARVTDYVPNIISFIDVLIKKGFGYSTPDGSVYFRVDKYGMYGKLHPAESDSVRAEEGDGKESRKDFALWKGAKAGEPCWNAPWGQGRPGWHIECSTIASCLLGSTVDVHSGGVDLIFPHHENEEAQSCCYHGVNQWVNYWIHTGHLRLSGDVKMSKSLKNTISISEFLNKYSSYELRMFCLLTRYRNGIEYSEALMEQAVSVCHKLENFFNDCNLYIQDSAVFAPVDESTLFKCLEETKKSVLESLANDFDTPKAMTHILHLVSVTNKMLHKPASPSDSVRQPVTVLAVACNFVKDLLYTLGYCTESHSTDVHELTGLLNSSVLFRSQVRKAALSIDKTQSKESIEIKKSLLSYCDSYRKDLLADGIELKDQKEKSSWNILKKRKG